MDYKNLITYTKDLTILYAEDDKKTNNIINNLLLVLFKKVISVENGLQAIEKYEKEKFDLVILDIEMPMMNGIQAGSQIKRINQKQKLMFLTAFDEISYLTDALKMQANEYILKPLNEAEFLEKIYKILK